jgi:DNA-binding transcriptional LysR family regulator
MMLSDQLRYFVVAARTEHIGRAAEQLELSQPALSRSIHKLEEELGLPLFDRAGRGVRLNEAGKILLRRVERACAEFDDALSELKELGKAKPVSIGYLSTFGVSLIPELVKGFAELGHKDKFGLFEAPCPTLVEQLLQGKVDLCLSTQLVHPSIDWRPLFNEELYALIPTGHRFASRKNIDLIELANEPFVALTEGHGLRQVLEDLCRQAGFKPNVILEGYEVGSLRGLVASGFGVTLAPKRQVFAPMYMDVPVSSPRCYRTVGLSWRRERWLSSRALAFKDYLVRQLETPEIGGKAGLPENALRLSRKLEIRPSSQASATTTLAARKASMSRAG